MKFLLRLCLLAALATHAWAQVSFKVAKVEIRRVGPVNVSDELIRANIRVKAGDPYQPIAVDEDVRNLYRTGFFYDIRIDRRETSEGLLLTYIVQAKPKMAEIRIVGNTKYRDSTLRKKLTSKIGEPLD